MMRVNKGVTYTAISASLRVMAELAGRNIASSMGAAGDAQSGRRFH